MPASRFNKGNPPSDDWIRTLLIAADGADWVSYRMRNAGWGYHSTAEPFHVRKVIAVPGAVGKANYWLVSSPDDVPMYWRVRGQKLAMPTEWPRFTLERPLVAGRLLHLLIERKRFTAESLSDAQLWADRKWPIEFGRRLVHALRTYRDFQTLTEDQFDGS